MDYTDELVEVYITYNRPEDAVLAVASKVLQDLVDETYPGEVPGEDAEWVITLQSIRDFASERNLTEPEGNQ